MAEKKHVVIKEMPDVDLDVINLEGWKAAGQPEDGLIAITVIFRENNAANIAYGLDMLQGEGYQAELICEDSETGRVMMLPVAGEAFALRPDELLVDVKMTAAQIQTLKGVDLSKVVSIFPASMEDLTVEDFNIGD
jgi:hypothetical protein